MNEVAALIAAYLWFALFLAIPASIGFFMWSDRMDDLRARKAERSGLYALAQKHAYYRGVQVQNLEHLVEDHGTYKLPTAEGKFLRERLHNFMEKQLAKPYAERPKGRRVFDSPIFGIELRRS